MIHHPRRSVLARIIGALLLLFVAVAAPFLTVFITEVVWFTVTREVPADDGRFLVAIPGFLAIGIGLSVLALFACGEVLMGILNTPA